MKHNSRISTVSILGVLCMCITGASAHAASSVRALGGAGTYAGTASAGGATSTTVAAANTSAASRAGSVRVTPTTNKTSKPVTISTGNTSAARGAATSRLSIGKYLGSAITTGGKPLRPNVSTGTGGGNTTIISGDVEKIVESLNKKIDDIENKISDLEAGRRLQAGDFISINDDEISVNVDALADALKDELKIPDTNTGTLEIIVDGEGANRAIFFCYSADSNSVCNHNDYKQLITIDELRREIGIDTAIAQVENSMNDRITNAINNLNLKALAHLDTVGTDQIDDGAVTTAKVADGAITAAKLGPDVQLGGNVNFTDEQMNAINSGITESGVTQIGLNTAAIADNTDAITTNTDNISANATAIAANATAITTNTTNITANTNAIAANTEALKQKANVADVYARTETYSQEQIDKKLQGITAGGVGPAPDDANYAWVSLGGKQDWIPIADGTDVVNAGE